MIEAYLLYYRAKDRYGKVQLNMGPKKQFTTRETYWLPNDSRYIYSTYGRRVFF